MRDRAKNDIVLYSMRLKKCVGPDMFLWIRHYVAEVCAPPSALLVCNGILIFTKALVPSIHRDHTMYRVLVLPKQSPWLLGTILDGLPL